MILHLMPVATAAAWALRSGAGPDQPIAITRARSVRESILYGTGGIASIARIAVRSAHLLAQPEAAFTSIRRPEKDCFLSRIARMKG